MTDKFNRIIQKVNQVILEEETTTGEYMALLHVLICKALSENPKGVERGFIAFLKKDILRIRLEKLKEQQYVRS